MTVKECQEEADSLIKGSLPLVLKWSVDRQLVQSACMTTGDKAALITHILEQRLANFVIVPTLKPLTDKVDEAVMAYQAQNSDLFRD